MTRGKKQAAAAGTWPSPISSASIVAGSKRLASPRIESHGVYWLEGRPAEKGRVVLVREDNKGAVHDLTPAPFSVRSKAHEYGGGTYAVAPDQAWFVNAADQCIYSVTRRGCKPLTRKCGRRYADLLLDASRERLICVCEDHGVAGEPVTTLVAVSLRDGQITTLMEGADFYSSPALSHDDSRLAWQSWSHPDMPWDASSLWLATIDEDGGVADPRKIGDPRASHFQPSFGPDGRLYFVADYNQWWNIHVYDGDAIHPVTRMQREFALPQWVFGMSTYGFVDPQTIAAISTADGLWALHTIALDTGAVTPVAAFDYTALSHLHAHAGRVITLAGSPDTPTCVVETVLHGAARGTNRVLAHSSTLTIERAWLSVGQPMTFCAKTPQACHGFYYPPVSRDYRLADDERPPVLVKCHGGPTAATTNGLDPRIQYWTSRGIAVLDLNYRGSTGYGRDYRHALRGQWGIADVADCKNAVQELARLGLADPARCLISGGSAGGYTVLCALTFTDAFAAGASHYGIGDLELLARDTHKFESRYLDGVVGPYPEEREKYRARSPIHHVEQMRCPVIFFQGLDDKVVPPNQAQTMVAALRENGVTVAYVPFEGEGHGFRNADNIRYSLDAELSFYAHVLDFVPAGGSVNLDAVLFESDNQ